MSEKIPAPYDYQERTGKRPKKGDVCPITGRVFVQRYHACKHGQHWTSPENYRKVLESQKKSAERRKKHWEKIKAAEPPYDYEARTGEKPKRGAVCDVTGLVFVTRTPHCRYGQRWVTPEKFEQIRERARENRTVAAKRWGETKPTSPPYDFERREGRKPKNGDTCGVTGKVFWAFGRGYRYNQSWVSRSNYEKRTRARRKQVRNRRKNNPQFRVICLLRDRLRAAMRGHKRRGQGAKKPSVRDIIGCSIEHLVAHLESQFTPEMSWGNHGEYWHIDHFLPCCSFDHTDREQLLACWNWKNLRPLEATKNLSKGGKIPETPDETTL